MKRLVAAIAAALIVLGSGAAAAAQSPEAGSVQGTATAAPPTLIRIDGQIKSAPGAARTDTVLLVIGLYEAQDSPTPLWIEQQVVAVDANGRYTVSAGATLPEGVPRQYFTSDAARWVGVAVEGQAEQPRIMLLSAPYALKARDADTLAGKTAADFVMADHLTESVKSTLKSEGVKSNQGAAGSGPLTASTVGQIAKFADTANTVVDSIITESSGNVGIDTTSPGELLTVANNGWLGYRNQGGTTTYKTLTVDAANDLYLQYPATRSLNIRDTSGAQALKISGGKVVIGGTFTAGLFTVGGSQLGNAGLEIVPGSGVVVQSFNRSTGLYASQAFDALAHTYRFRSPNGTQVGFRAVGPVTLTGATVGIDLDLATNITPAAQSISAQTTTLPAVTVANSNTYKGQSVSMPALTSVAGETTFVGYDVQMPAITQSGGILKSYGIRILGGAVTSGTSYALITDANAGNVGIGTPSPTAKLDVAGNINVSGNINAKYQDVAEWVETAEPLEPGTIVIVDPVEPDRVLPSARPYDTRVAGAVSRQPGLILGERGDTKAMVAQSGRVRVKVDATYGAIRPGDLLVTSPTPGYAMRSKPINIGGQSLHRPGTLLGKALEALPKGKGEILVLLTLQ